MNWLKRIQICWLGCLLASMAGALAGCGTPQFAMASNAHLEKYRKVYLLPSHDDARSVTPRILGRLTKTGFDAILVSSNTPGLRQGSGFVITPEGHVLTCAHVIGQLTNATVWINGMRYPCSVLASDTNADLALLRVEADHLPFRPVMFATETNYAMGQDVFTMGFPLVAVLGSEPRLNKGLISAAVGINDNPKFVQISAASQPGDSGGPLLNPRGEAIGVIAGTLNPIRVAVETGGALPQNVNFAIKANIVRAFLETNHITLPAAVGGTATFSVTATGTPAPAYQWAFNNTNNPSGANNEGFEGTRKSLALVRSGIVTDEELKQPALVCVFGYNSVAGLRPGFKRIEIAFFDLDTHAAIFKAGQYQDRLSSENAELDRLFMEISNKFFPNRLTNPFLR